SRCHGAGTGAQLSSDFIAPPRADQPPTAWRRAITADLRGDQRGVGAPTLRNLRRKSRCATGTQIPTQIAECAKDSYRPSSSARSSAERADP
ncbi:MAG TPA: hypothetical protein VGM38_08370, partial [Pseudolysinimonas sp.]